MDMAPSSHCILAESTIVRCCLRLSRLEERAAEKKPSIKEALAAHTAKIAQAQKDAPAAERPRPAER